MEHKNEDNKHWTLLDLPVYSLRILLSYLDATSLYQLSRTCTYLRDCIEDPKLWKYVDARGHPNTSIKLLYCTENLNEKTTHIFFGAKLGYGRIPNYFFDKIKPFNNLRVLSLEYQTLGGFGLPMITLKDFPSSLEELSLKSTVLKTKDPTSFFQHSSGNMKQLRVLILDHCAWLTCSFMMSVAKYENIEIISIVNCPRIHLHTVPYLNVAKLGLKKLKVLDCRFTGIGAELLHTFYSKESIQKFYFQSFNCAQADYSKNLYNNSKVQLPTENNVDLQISNYSLLQYHGITVSTDVQEKIYDSILYKDPYPECTCGYDEYHTDGPVADCEISNDDIPISHVTRFICEKHLKDINVLPDTLKDFCGSSQLDTAQDVNVSDDSSDDDFPCCTIGTTSKMVILQNTNDVPRRQEIVLPSTSSSDSDRQMNIFIVNPLVERENAAAQLDNVANENRQNQNRDQDDDSVGNENRGDDHNHLRENGVIENGNKGADAIKGSDVKEDKENAANENSENSVGENLTNVDDRVDAAISFIRKDQLNKKKAVEITNNKNGENEGEDATPPENENNENKFKENFNVYHRERLHLPSTSRGILENCMNENTENLRIEVERQNRNEEIKEDISDPSSCSNDNEMSSIKNDQIKEEEFDAIKHTQKRKINSSEENSIPENESNLTKRRLVCVSKENLVASSTCDLVEPKAAPSTSRGSGLKDIDKPCSSGLHHRFKDLTKDRVSKKRKRSTDSDGNNTSGAGSREYRGFLRTTPSFSGGRAILDPSFNPINAVPSGIVILEGPEAIRSLRYGLPSFNIVAPERHIPLLQGIPPVSGEDRFVDEVQNAEVDFEGRVVPEIHRDDNGNHFRVVRFSRIIGSPERARRVNIRQVFPLPPFRAPAFPQENLIRNQLQQKDYKVSLTHLSLRGYKRISNSALYYIKHLNLELLDLTYTSVTREGIENFILENPSCRIIHKNYCICKPRSPF